MIWRLWSFVAGAPLGVLAILAFGAAPSGAELALAALAGGALVVALASSAALFRARDPERGGHLARGASGALVALPALGAALLGFAPGARWLFLAAAAVCAAALARGAAVRGSSGGLRGQLVAAIAALAGGAVAVVAAAAIAAHLAATPDAPAARAAMIYDYDARVALQPAPVCARRPARTEPLLDRGARPRLTRDGSTLFYDAAVDDGTRQVHSLDRASGVETCWTCGEAGTNVRPAPGARGEGVVFETDRYASWRDPTNTELQFATERYRARGLHSRRLTNAAGPDDHAVFGPDSRLLVWSRGSGGRFAARSRRARGPRGGRTAASHRRATGAPGRRARTLVVATGNPFGPPRAVLVDLATTSELELLSSAAGVAGASFSADGSQLAFASARRAHAAGLLPDALGFALASVVRARGAGSPPLRETGVLTGETGQAVAPIELGDTVQWGAPTGVALEPDGSGFVLGQRRETGGVPEERLIEITLECES
jgi:hypothetical protein